jgi:hypothetical protein
MANPFDKLLLDDERPGDRLARARWLLRPKRRHDPAWPALAAAAFFAISALTFALGSMTGPLFATPAAQTTTR